VPNLCEHVGSDDTPASVGAPLGRCGFSALAVLATVAAIVLLTGCSIEMRVLRLPVILRITTATTAALG
jgi:hypothetical protein